MNLWRRSKSWFYDGFSVQRDDFDAKCYLDHEKQLVEKKYEREKKLLAEQYQKQLSRLKTRYATESRQLQDAHSRLISQGKRVAISPKETPFRSDVSPSENRHLVLEDDGLEWDPSDDLKSYSEEDMSDGWDIQSDISQCSFGWENDRDENEIPDSAYSSLTSFVGLSSSNGCPQNEMEKQFEQLRAVIRQEAVKECEEKFREERKFFYSIIDELEENVSLLRKQKEDIVLILESEAKDNSAV